MTGQPIDEKGAMTAVLFDIQRFSVNDGPGIRTNLFFKGCPLRCIWCHNPESYLPGRQLSFNQSGCTGCGECVQVCPEKANRPVPVRGKIRIRLDHQKCSRCGQCIQVCCYGARTMIGKQYTAAQLRDQVLTDLEYYKILDREGLRGGITLTGGEPMSQFPFLDEFLYQVEGIHVCMETSGYAPRRQYEKLLGRVDCFLFDYKVTDTKKHRALCGVDNSLIQENLRFLCERGQDIILRLPLIPGVNDEEEHFQAVADLINRNPNIRRGEIMAYHNMGIGKAEQIGMDTRGQIPRFLEASATKEQKEEWLARFKRLGLKRIGFG